MRPNCAEGGWHRGVYGAYVHVNGCLRIGRGRASRGAFRVRFECVRGVECVRGDHMPIASGTHVQAPTFSRGVSWSEMHPPACTHPHAHTHMHARTCTHAHARMHMHMHTHAHATSVHLLPTPSCQAACLHPPLLRGMHTGRVQVRPSPPLPHTARRRRRRWRDGHRRRGRPGRPSRRGAARAAGSRPAACLLVRIDG